MENGHTARRITEIRMVQIISFKSEPYGRHYAQRAATGHKDYIFIFAFSDLFYKRQKLIHLSLFVCARI